jgi:hypothetical protein
MAPATYYRRFLVATPRPAVAQPPQGSQTILEADWLIKPKFGTMSSEQHD